MRTESLMERWDVQGAQELNSFFLLAHRLNYALHSRCRRDLAGGSNHNYAKRTVVVVGQHCAVPVQKHNGVIPRAVAQRVRKALECGHGFTLMVVCCARRHGSCKTRTRALAPKRILKCCPQALPVQEVPSWQAVPMGMWCTCSHQCNVEDVRVIARAWITETTRRVYTRPDTGILEYRYSFRRLA